MFQIEMLPAREGDCLWLTYGQAETLHRILIDGGRAGTYTALQRRLEKIPENEREFELLVVTHVDRDHIEGVLAMLEDEARPARFNEIWFNGYDHLLNKEIETFGAIQGERLTSAILKSRIPWNKSFQGKAIETADRRPTTVELEGGLKLTVLSPNRKKLEALIPRWEDECRKEGLIPGIKARKRELLVGMESFGSINIDDLAHEPFHADHSEPNGTSIALLAEYEGKRVLLAGDAHQDLLETSVRSLAERGGGHLRLDGMKVSHHGSSHNTSRTGLDLVACQLYLVSTSGSIYHHPDQSAMARLIRFGGSEKEIIFNYRSEETTIWDNPRWKAKHGYQTRYPDSVENGTAVVAL
jgi:beta-lactamase superfamily II metal-dependent hydrolase